MSASFDSDKGQKSAHSDPEGRPIPDKDRDVIALSESRQARHAEFLDALQRAVEATRSLHTSGEPPAAEPEHGSEPEQRADEIAMFAARSARRPLERTPLERKLADRTSVEPARYETAPLARAPVERASFGRRPLERMPFDRAGGASPVSRPDGFGDAARRPEGGHAMSELPRALRPHSEELASEQSLPDRPGHERMPRTQSFEFDMTRRRAEAIDRLKQHQLERAMPPGVAAGYPLEQIRGRGWLASTARLGLVGVVVAAGAFAAMQFVAANGRAPAVGQGLGTALWSRVFGSGETVAVARHQPARLVLSELSGVANRPVALGVKVDAAPSGASLLVRGLPPGSRITAGAAAGATAWRVPVRELGHAAVMPPANFTGVMNLTVDLRRPDDSVADTDVLRVSWTPNAAETVVPKPVMTTTIGSGVTSFPKSSAPVAAEPEPPAASEAAPPEPQPIRTAATAIQRHLDRDEVMNLLKRGQFALQNGDIAAARLLLRRAAEAGDAPAAMTLAATFDPRVLRQLGALGSNADVEKARSWYQKAAEMGSKEASQRLQLLAQQSR